jgi:hypothetical protein
LSPKSLPKSLLASLGTVVLLSSSLPGELPYPELTLTRRIDKPPELWILVSNVKFRYSLYAGPVDKVNGTIPLRERQG